ncbi:MAG: hypothetical protein EA425_13895 [Puniceicoccaceae bacterium]|nr:MAG: hypothetical protein EA425_13895 [Puniceicoccaceae bacterium]
MTLPLLPPLPPPVLALSEHPTLLEDIQYQLVGFFIVLLTLISIWLTLEVLGRLFRAAAARKAAAAEAAAADAAARPDPLEPQVVAAIAAAVDVVVRDPHRILSVTLAPDQPSSLPSVQQTAWSVEGRRQIYSSHKVR